jgi:WD40 repeat protein
MRRILVPGVVLLAILSVPAQEKPRLDADPLPPGALLRLGTTRFRAGGMPTSVAFLDATTLVSGGEEGAVRFWEVPTGRELRAIPGTMFAQMPLATDGKVLLGVDRQCYFTAWDARTGKVLRKFGYAPYPTGAGFHGDRFAFSTQTEATLWDIDGQKPLHTLRKTQDRPHLGPLTVSTDGSITAAAHEGTIRLFETATGKPITELTARPDAPVYLLAFNPGKPTLLAAVEFDGQTRLWDVRTGKSLHVFQRGWGTAVAFSPDGKWIALGGHPWDEGIALFDLATFEEVKRFAGGPRYTTSLGLAFSPDGKYLASAGSQCTVQLWEVATGKSLHREDQPQSGIRDMVLSPDGKSLLVGHDYLGNRVWDLTTGQLRATLSDEKAGVPAGWGKDGRILIGRPGSFEATFYWHDIVTGKEEKAFRAPYSIHTLALVGERPTLVILTTNNGNLALWDAVRGVEVAAPERIPGTEAYYGLAMSADGKRLATSGVVRDVPSGKVVRLLKPGHGTTVYGVAFSPDGKTVATVSYSEVLLYETEGDRPPKKIELPEGDGWSTGYGVAFHPDGKHLAVANRDNVALHELDSGKVVRRWEGHRGPVRQLAFIPDGRRLITAGSEGAILVWDATPPGK